MRYALAAVALMIAGSALAAQPSRELLSLMPSFITATVSSDMAGPGDVDRRRLARCLVGRGVTVLEVRAAIKAQSPDAQMTACLDQVVGR